MKERKERILRIAFLAGAITDAGALLPMLSPRFADLLWGLHDTPASYRLAMGSGASLMLGWTILLLWAYRRPLERRAIAAFTAVVIAGFIVTEICAVQAGVLAAGRMAPTFVLQSVLLGLFAAAFYSGRARGSVAAQQAHRSGPSQACFTHLLGRSCATLRRTSSSARRERRGP